MAVTVEELRAVLRMEMKPFQRDLQTLQGVNARTARSVEKTWRETNRKLDGFGKGMARGLIAPLTGVAAAMSVREVGRYADAWTVAGNKIAAAGQIAGRQGRSLEGVNEIANRTRSGISETVDLYAKLLRSTATVAESEEQVARATEIVNKAFKAGGAAASEQAAGVLQLSQALGSGLLQGDELRSIRENAPLLAQAIADEFQTTISGLKDLGSEGQLTTDRVFKAILASQPKIEAAFGKTNVTIADGMTKVSNALTQYIGQTDSSLSATARLTAGLNAFADDFDNIADKTLKLAAIIAGALVGRSIAGMIANIGLGTAAIYRFVTALRAARTMAQLGIAMGGLSAAAGPVGLAIGTVLTGALIAFGSRSGEASEAAAAYARALKEVEDAANSSAEAAEDSSKRYVEAEKKRAKEAADFGVEKAKKARDDLIRAMNKVQILPGEVTKSQAEKYNELADAFEKGTISAEVLSDEMFKLAEINPKFDEQAKKVEKYAKALDNAAKTAGNLRDKERALGSSGVPLDPQIRLAQSRDAANAAAAQQAQFFEQQRLEAQRTDFEREIDTKAKGLIESAKKMGIALDEATAKLKARELVPIERAAKELDSGISGYVNKVIGAESGGDRHARNSKSSATGLGQFIESTWIDLFKKNFPDRAEGLSRSAILAFRTNASDSKALIEAYARENAALLQKAGLSVNEAALHLAHFLGPQGAIKVLSAAPGTPIAGLLDAAAIKANPTILGPGSTVDSVRGYAEKRAGMHTEGARMAGAREDFARSLEEQKAYIAALQAETGLRAALNPLINDYGKAMSTIEAAQQLLTEAQREGIEAGLELKDVQQLLHGDLSTLSPAAREQALAMRALAEETGKAEAAGNLLTESNGKLRQRLEDSSSLGKDVLGGFIRDLRDGKKATEALASALGKVGDKLLDIALNSLFDGPNAGSGGGPLGGLFKGLFSFFGSYDQGGYTGHGGKLQPAGVVHKGEYVFDQDSVKAAGGPATLDALRKKLKGYSGGGYVGGAHPMSMPQMPKLPPIPASGSAQQGVAVSVGVSMDNNGNLQAYVKDVAQQQAVTVSRSALTSYDKQLNRSFGSRMVQAQGNQL